MEIRLLSVSSGQLMGMLAALFVVSVVYAALLEVAERRWGFVSAYTWLAVVIGVAYTLVGLAWLSVEGALMALAAFAASSVPIIARSVVNDVGARNERMDRWQERGRWPEGPQS